MTELERLKDKIDALNSENFEKFAIEIFSFQYSNNKIYKKFVDALGKKVERVNKMEQIPFMPISFFKTQRVHLDSLDYPEVTFESSGTSTAISSRHHVFDKNFYLNHSLRTFEKQYGPLNDYVILALLPSYLEKGNSSLIAMVDFFVKKSQSPYAGFYLYNYQELLSQIEEIRSQAVAKKIIIWGVSFALIDLAEKFAPDLSDCIIMETGGMKGRRAELTRIELHNYLNKSFKSEKIHSEYGMTELFSQAYSKGEGLFKPAETMKIFTREVNDPLTINKQSSRAGGINVIDLANIDSCCFIETQDIGRVYEDGQFEVLGRFDNSDIRGCNLLVS